MVTSRSPDTPWKPATTGTRPSFEGVAQAVAAHLDDLGVGVRRVGDDAGLATGEGHGVHPLVGQRHAQQGHRDPLARGQQHVQLAGGRMELTSPARRKRSSVVLPMALTTTTTSSPASAGAGDVVSHGADAIGVSHRGAAELLDQQSHAPTLLICTVSTSSVGRTRVHGVHQGR